MFVPIPIVICIVCTFSNWNLSQYTIIDQENVQEEIKNCKQSK